jgi:hypothetical protein
MPSKPNHHAAFRPRKTVPAATKAHPRYPPNKVSSGNRPRSTIPTRKQKKRAPSDPSERTEGGPEKICATYLPPRTDTIPPSIATLGRSITRQTHVATRRASVAVGTRAVAHPLETADAAPHVARNVVGRHIIGLRLTTILVRTAGMTGSITRDRSRRSIARNGTGVGPTRPGLSHAHHAQTKSQRKNNSHIILREEKRTTDPDN